MQPSQLEVRDLILTPPPSGEEYKVTASVKNKSTVNVTAVKLDIFAYDCPEGATNVSSCDIVGHDDNVFKSTIPVGEVRQISGVVILSNIPKLQNKFAWSFRLVGVKSELESPWKDEGDLLARYFGC